MINLVVVYLASPRIASWLRWTRLDCLYASLYLLKKHVRPLPVIVFHEDYTEDDKQRLLKTGLDITFEKVDFSGMEQFYIDNRPGTRVGSYGYCMMCRFFSGILQNHSLLQPYSHYMRLDDDSYIISKVEDDYLDEILKYDYVYDSTFEDPYESLQKFTEHFLASQQINFNLAYNGNVPYTNFHTSSLSIWRHPIIKKYTDKIEECHGCLNQRWDDAQIGKTVSIMSEFLGFKTKIMNFPYRHNQQCCHKGPHTIYCKDGRSDQYPWGPPLNLEEEIL